MQTISVKEGQCVIDIAMQYSGDAGQAIATAMLNNIGITDTINIGQALTALDADITKQFITVIYVQQGIIPASVDDSEPLCEGIGYWRIGFDFVVS